MPIASYINSSMVKVEWFETLELNNNIIKSSNDQLGQHNNTF